MSRVILHSDANAFYASVECLYHPELRDLPVAVCGDPSERHGIVLAKNQPARVTGIKTGEAIWQARQKCPNLVVLKPNYDQYLYFSQKLRNIYGQYTDRVEAFGLDENWLDLSEPGMGMERGFKIAEEIRNRAREELGLTVSIGVSFNKVFAKLGSDYKKPDATTLISEENYQQIVWPLPVSELLYVGPRTTKKLMDMGVRTIGELAKLDASMLQSRFGKNGLQLKAFAMGLDRGSVLPAGVESAIKSIGNSTTPPHDIRDAEDAKRIFCLLAESVATRLREHGFRAGCVAISARTTDLEINGCQRALKHATNLTGDLFKTAMELFHEHCEGRLPLRSVGLCCSALISEDAPMQLDLLGESRRREQEHALEITIDELRRRFGHQVVRRGVVLADAAFASINPRAEASPSGVAFVMGNRGAAILG